MTELRVNHNDQMLVFQGIDSSTCLQSVISNPKQIPIKSANVKRNTDNSIENCPLNIIIHKSLTNRAQTATAFLGQKYAPIQHNDFIASAVLVGHNFTDRRSKVKTDEPLYNDKVEPKIEISKANEIVIHRGKSAPLLSYNSKITTSRPVDSFVIKPAFTMEIQRKSFLYLSRETTFLNIEATRSTDTVILNNYFTSNLNSNQRKFLDHKPEVDFKAILGPTISYQSKRLDKCALLWSEDLKSASLLGYSKGRVPFQAVLAARKHISSISKC